jgi:SHS2 domain-containing protein
MTKTKNNKKILKFKFLEHTADVKFQAFGKTIEKAFGNSALAMAETMTKGEKVAPPGVPSAGGTEKSFFVKGKDNESLLYGFLEEFLYLLDAEDFILSKVKKILIKDNVLKAIVIGDKASKYKFTNDVKAVTYNEMFVRVEKSRAKRKEEDKFICQVVLDV